MNAKKQTETIIGYEARLDDQGRIALYKLPINDGGGKWEYAGINDRYHPTALEDIRAFLAADRHDLARDYAIEYIRNYTEPASKVSKHPAIQFAMRDICWNRGLGGARKTLQRALKVTPDGSIGPKTKAALLEAEKDLPAFLQAIRRAREKYEREVCKRDEGSSLWKGLVNRWNKQLKDSTKML